jgi:hypothetical protein
MSFGGDSGGSSRIDTSGDVVLNNPSDKQVLGFDGGSSKWTNQTIDKLVFNVRDYGAEGTGAHDDTSAIQSAIDAAQAAGGVCFLPAGVYNVSSSLTVGSGKFEFRGSGGESVLACVATMTAVISSNNTRGSTFADFAIIGNNQTTYGLSLTMDTEDSTGNLLFNVSCSGATSYQFYIDGHEDTTLAYCKTDGSESPGSTIPPALYWYTPFGLGNIVGGALFGRCVFNAQVFNVVGATLGPIVVDNPSLSIVNQLNLFGCYVYDLNIAGARTDCIADNSNHLCNITAIGTWFVALNNGEIIRGDMLADTLIKLENCTYLGPDGNTEYILALSGSGAAVIDGGAVGSTCTWKAYQSLSGGTTVVKMTSAIANLTGLPSPVLAAPAVPAAGNSVTNTQPFAVSVYVSGGTGVNVTLDGTPTGLATGSFHVAPGITIGLGSYSAAPSWVWVIA